MSMNRYRADQRVLGVRMRLLRLAGIAMAIAFCAVVGQARADEEIAGRLLADAASDARATADPLVAEGTATPSIVATQPAPTAETSGRPAGPDDWLDMREARRVIRPGETAGDLSVAIDGSVRYRGEALFTSVSDPAATELRLFLAPDARRAFVMQWNADWGGQRAALIDLGAQRILRNDIIPETAVQTIAAAADVRMAMLPVAWSPEGRYVAFPLSPREWRADLVFLDARTGQKAVHVVDDLKPGEWSVPKLEALHWDGNGRAAIDYDVLTCADPDCTAPEVVGSVTSNLNIPVLITDATREESRSAGGFVDRQGAQTSVFSPEDTGGGAGGVVAYNVHKAEAAPRDGSAPAGRAGVTLPIPSFAGNFSALFYDPDYPTAWSPPAQHLGVDLPGKVEDTVVSPVDGAVVYNRTVVADPLSKYLVIREDLSRREHVLAHIDSNLSEGEKVALGQPVGRIVRAGTGPHVHWGVNSGSVISAIDVSAGWGFGRGPLGSSPVDAGARGWLDPLSLLSANMPSAMESGDVGTGSLPAVARDLERACDGGDSTACNDLGTIYWDGKSVAQDFHRSAQLFRRACDGGNMDSCNALSGSYFLGRGVPKDDGKAAELVRRACAGGNLEGCRNLGYYYEHAHGVARDLQRAAELYRRSCEGGLGNGCTELARLSRTPGEESTALAAPSGRPAARPGPAPPGATSDAAPVRPVRLQVSLVDGSVIAGDVTTDAIPFASVSGVVPIPVSDILSFADGVLRLGNGTTLVGNFAAGAAVPIETTFGRVSVPTDQIGAIAAASTGPGNMAAAAPGPATVQSPHAVDPIVAETAPSATATTGEPAGWNDAKRGIARDLLTTYDQDVDEIEAVARAASYSLLAWAAYDDEEALTRATNLGWDRIEQDEEERFLVGDVTYALFRDGAGGHVLAFRGTKTFGDWITNLDGTLSPTPLLNGQVADAMEVAKRVVAKHRRVVFTGHSLGGRLAQAASLQTGRPAYVFNSAPVGLNEIREMGFVGLVSGDIHRFRSPQDQLSRLFPAKDHVVANLPSIEESANLHPKNIIDFSHAMGVLAKAMLDVRIVLDKGWITAYLQEQEAADTGQGSAAGTVVKDSEKAAPPAAASASPAAAMESTAEMIDPADLRDDLEELGRLLGLEADRNLLSAETYRLAQSPEELVPECDLPAEVAWLGEQLRAQGPLRFIWTGKCKGGIPVGDGQIIALNQDDEAEWYWVIGPGSLLGLSETGRLYFDIPLPPIKVECDVLRTARLDLRGPLQAVDIANDFLLVGMFQRAADSIVETCGGDGYRNIAVILEHPGYPDGAVARGRNYDVAALTWREWSNVAKAHRASELRNLNDGIRERRRAAEAAQREQARAERRTRLLNEWTDRVKKQLDGTVPIENLADLLKYDRLRTLQALAEGRTIRLAVTEPSFRNDQFVVTNQHKAFNVDEALAGPGFSWEGWIQLTQGRGEGVIELTCLFQADAIAGLQLGQSYSVEAKLVDASGSSVVMQCAP